jgi:outer membrane protein assembly factor BamB
MFMKALLPVVFVLGISISSPNLTADWLQWGGNARHTGQAAVVGQPLTARLADVVYDPFVAEEVRDGGGDLFVHYQTPLIDGNDVFLEFKSGTYSSNDWATQVWGVRKLSWSEGRLVTRWEARSDWKPEPRGGVFFEPVFHAALRADALFMPAASGGVLEIDRASGAVIRRIAPFQDAPNAYVAGPLVVDPSGNVYYDAIQLNASDPYFSDVIDSWLVRIAASGPVSTASFRTLIQNAPTASDPCLTTFSGTDLPWPPSREAVPPSAPCGSQRAGINIAPAVGVDGTIYTVTRAHLNGRYSYLVAINSDLTPKWSVSLRDRLFDGCNVLLPPNGSDGGCRAGAMTGVDPADNTFGAGQVLDDSSSCPVVAPDGSILYGAFTSYNYEQGHLMQFSPSGQFLHAYQFGWDITPAIYEHDGTFSIVTKENHYPVGSYCFSCSGRRNDDNPVGYFITQLDSQLRPQWQFKSTNTESCTTDNEGNVGCRPDQPGGFEWCVNGPAVDAGGVVYANSEDGNVYAIRQGGVVVESIFLQLALGAAYTPVSIGSDGKIYTQNAGHLFVVGSPTSLPVPARRRAAHH